MDAAGIVVRESTPADVESFRSCLDAVARERRWLALLEAPPLDEVRRFFESQRRRGMIQFVAAAAARVVGWCDVIPKNVEGFRHSSDLGMGLLAEQRGRGLGRALLERTLEATRRSGLLRVELEVYATNTAAIALYERCGFRHEGLRRRARLLDGSADDVVEMALLFDESRGSGS
jgi:ribosomal protein S18 acetylase RimI-like enzyme